MIRKLLIANRGEIAVRIIRTSAEMSIETMAVASEDDSNSLHLRQAGCSQILNGRGPAAYLDTDQIVRVARDAGCDAIHPGYGFLSENADFARACVASGMLFVGPSPEQLEVLGDKAAARQLAERCGVGVPAGTKGAVSLDEARQFMVELGRPVMIKALSGGGGRGIRLVETIDQLEAAFDRCRSEALRSFGDDRVYAEQAIINARHIEVQIVGDGTGNVVHLGERDCTVQRRNQKLIEIAPSPALSRRAAEGLFEAAMRMASSIAYSNAGTFEFLVEAAESGDKPPFYFLEANPRLQVEHTVTEELWGVDLIRTQLRVAARETIADIGLDTLAPRVGYALQARINMERLAADGTPMMDGGAITVFEPATGPGIRVDSFGYRGYVTNVAFDSLLAKLIVNSGSPDFSVVVAKAQRALSEFAVHGVSTNIAFLRAILADPMLTSDSLTTRFVDLNLTTLLAAAAAFPEDTGLGSEAPAAPAQNVDETLPAARAAVRSPLTGAIVDLLIKAGQSVDAGQAIAVAEAMKMEHVVTAPCSGTIDEVRIARGATIGLDEILATIIPDGRVASALDDDRAVDLDRVRPDLAELIERQQGALDAARSDPIAKRHAKGQRTARENVAAVCDPDSFIEYGSLVVAGQRARRSIDELVRRTPADGVIVGFGTVNGDMCTARSAQTLVIAFDETVLAGTTGEMAREKMKHALSVAQNARRPVILFAEGGGGRAGDTDGKIGITGWTMDVSTYYQLGRMSGLTPLVGVVSGRCFAANAGMLACCDVIIATERANIGVGGPSMIEGGRLGQFTPEQIGPMDVQTRNGVVDILVPDEGQAAATARQYLSYFQGPLTDWACADQRLAREVVPENRLRAYDMREAIEILADTGTVLELRPKFGLEMITALIRVEGRPLGVIANNPMHVGGAIESDGADKASHFMRLCEAFGLPILMLCDTPGMMVGPEAEKTATVRKMGRMFITGANLTVPFFTIVTRKGYGIGAELMAGGWFKAPRFTVSWPTGEFGGMNIEGNVKLAHAAELEAIKDPDEKRARFEALVADMYATGRALSVATHYEIDNVIDPAESRRWIASAMMTHIPRLPGSDKVVPYVDPW